MLKRTQKVGILSNQSLYWSEIVEEKQIEIPRMTRCALQVEEDIAQPQFKRPNLTRGTMHELNWEEYQVLLLSEAVEAV